VKNDGTAEAWGISSRGGDASSVDLTNVASAMCGGYACVAVKNDGTAETWGHSSRGGDTSSVDLTNVASAMCGNYACVAVKNDGTAEAWGLSSNGGYASSVDLTNVASAMCGWGACVAVKNDGTAEAWGDSSYGGDASTVDLTDLTIPPNCPGQRVCGPDDYVVVDVMAHPTYGAHGRYFEISSLDWTTMAGAWNSFYNIDQWRDGVRIVENRQIRGWEDYNGIHGRYETFASSANGDWQPDDIISLTGNCESLATV